jgi:hypothetical protein
MRLQLPAKLRVFDGAVVVAASIPYGRALFSTAIGGFGAGPDFEFGPSSGISCLLTGWLYFPLGWLANPVLLCGVALLLMQRRLLAALCGLLAVGLACLWAVQFQREYSADLLREGYYSWRLGMILFAIGTLCSVVTQYGALLPPLGRGWKWRQSG